MKRSYCLFLLVLFGCNQNEAPEQTTSNSNDTSTISPPKSDSVRPVHWSYEASEGPQAWATLSPVYALCGTGKSQSPVNLVSKAHSESSPWKIDYRPFSLHIAHHENVQELINNGHTIQVTPVSGSTLSLGSKNYELKQFHFHTPSEHTLNGKHFPMETHFVHQASDGSLAVIGVLVQEGKHNANFDQLIRHLPNSPGEMKTHDSVQIDLNLHIPNTNSAYHYIGSLTTPPCSENVQWMVLQKHVSMSKEQIAAFASRLKNNNRPTQPLNERQITVDTISSIE